MVKTRTILKWELNTHDNFVNLGAEDFFVGDVTVKYIQCESSIQNICSATECIKLICSYNAGSLEGNAHMVSSL